MTNLNRAKPGGSSHRIARGTDGKLRRGPVRPARQTGLEAVTRVAPEADGLTAVSGSWRGAG
jgi:hypothetical protein